MGLLYCCPNLRFGISQGDPVLGSHLGFQKGDEVFALIFLIQASERHFRFCDNRLRFFQICLKRGLIPHRTGGAIGFHVVRIFVVFNRSDWPSDNAHEMRADLVGLIVNGVACHALLEDLFTLGNIAISHGVSGVNSSNAMSCASGTLAIGEAFRAITSGQADVVLAGGSEAPLYPLCYGSFSLIRAMSTRNDDPGTASRPFDTGRDGFVMAEGSAVLVIESLERAVARGAPIYAEVAGFGLTNDAHHMTQPRPDGREAIRAMRLARG